MTTRDDTFQFAAKFALFLLMGFGILAGLGALINTWECSDTCAALGGRCYDAFPNEVCENPNGDRFMLDRVREVRHDGTVRTVAVEDED